MPVRITHTDIHTHTTGTNHCRIHPESHCEMHVPHTALRYTPHICIECRNSLAIAGVAVTVLIGMITHHLPTHVAKTQNERLHCMGVHRLWPEKFTLFPAETLSVPYKNMSPPFIICVLWPKGLLILLPEWQATRFQRTCPAKLSSFLLA